MRFRLVVTCVAVFVAVLFSVAHASAQDPGDPILSCHGDTITCDHREATASVSSTPSVGVSYLWTPSPLSGQGTANPVYDSPGSIKVVVTILATGHRDSCTTVIGLDVSEVILSCNGDMITCDHLEATA